MEFQQLFMKPQASCLALVSLPLFWGSCGGSHFLQSDACWVPVSHSGLSVSEPQKIKMVALLEGSISTPTAEEVQLLGSFCLFLCFCLYSWFLSFFFKFKMVNKLYKVCSHLIQPSTFQYLRRPGEYSKFIFNVFQKGMVPNHPSGVFKFQSP